MSLKIEARQRDIFLVFAAACSALLFWGQHGRCEILGLAVHNYTGPGSVGAARGQLIPGIAWDQELISFVVALVLACILPLFVLRVFAGMSSNDLGFGLPPPEKRKTAIVSFLAITLLLAVPFYFGAKDESMRAVYPIYRGPLEAWNFVAYELGYLMFFIALDGLLRGVLLFGLTNAGVPALIAIGAETLVQSTWHLGKPLSESLGAPLWGIVAGVVSYRVRSVWPVILAHWILNILIDLTALSF